MIKRTLIYGTLFIFAVSGCGPKAADVTVSEEAVSPEVKQAVAFDPATAGSVKGRILFEGEAPAPQKLSVQGNPECSIFHAGGSISSEEIVSKNGALQNVVVYVKEGLEGRTFAPPSVPVRIDNKQCVYAPHVIAAQVDQPVEFANSDPTLHNIHSYSSANKAFNLGLPIQGMKQVKKFSAPEVITLKCDVHPWMKGYVAVVANPFFQVTGEEGSFELKDLPPGEYLIEAWHEKLGAQSQKIKIEPQATQTVEFTFRA